MATAVKSKAGRKPRAPDPAPTMFDRAEQGSPAARVGELTDVRVALVDPSPAQPRTAFDETELRALADSMRESDLLQPITVRWTGTEHRERYELIAGERRLRAAKLLGWEWVAAIVRRADTAEAAALTAIENLQRAQLTPLEEAEAFAKLTQEQGWSQQELARRLGIPRATVGDRVRVLTLHPAWLALIRDGRVVQLSHAPTLLVYKDAPDAVHAAAVERIQRSDTWAYAAHKGRPIEVAPMVSAAFVAYSLDLWARSRADQLDGTYEGPTVSVRSYAGAPAPEEYFADPAIWLPMREAQTARTARELGSLTQDRGAAGVPAYGNGVTSTFVAHPNPPRADADAPRSLRADVVLRLPPGRGPDLERARTEFNPPKGVVYLTDDAGRWQVGPSHYNADNFDPADLQLADAALLEVRDHYAGAARAATRDTAAVVRARECWRARWKAREAELRAAQPVVDYTVRGPGVRVILADACDVGFDHMGEAMRHGAAAAGLAFPPDVETGIWDADTDVGDAAEAWLRDPQPLALAEAVATAHLRLVIEAGSAHRDPVVRQVQAEQTAAIAEIRARPVPWVSTRPPIPSDVNTQMFTSEGIGDEHGDDAEGDDDE